MLTHVFISYAHENIDAVLRLQKSLEDNGVDVWLDRDSIKPGTRWRSAIRDAISQGAFFISCFSVEVDAKSKSYIHEEITLAIDELRQRPTTRSWFIPVILSGTVPDRQIGAGETLRDLQWVDLRNDWDVGIRRLLSVRGSIGDVLII